MDINNLVQMANRIGDFFATQPDRQEAMSGIALHLQRFWEPRMRKAMLAFIDGQTQSKDGLELHELVLQAILAHRTELTPKT